MALHIDRARSDALCDWLTANGIEPNTVPVDGDLTIVDTADGRAIRIEVMPRTEDGRLMLDDRGVDPVREIRTVPLVVEPPTWWRPYEKPTRAQLLATVERVRKLHAPDMGLCRTCAAPAPCPTVRALDGEEQSSA